jgi:hypothetical protein
MQLDLDYLRGQFASLSDDALLAVNRADLVEVAQRVYDDEVGRRTVAKTESVIADAKQPPDWLDDAVEVYSFGVLPETNCLPEAATRLRELLERSGIPHRLQVTEIPAEPNKTSVHSWRLIVPKSEHLRATSALEAEIGNPEFEASWRTHLERLSNDELLNMDIKRTLPGLFDRVHRVKKAYKAEVRRRGVTDLRII